MNSSADSVTLPVNPQVETRRTSFSQDAVTLSGINSSATITVQATELPKILNGVQLNIQHPDAVKIESPKCAGIFSEGTASGSVAVSGGTMIACAVGHGITGTNGDVMQFDVVRLKPGNATLSFGLSGPFKTEYSAGGISVDPGATNGLTINS
ncbi:MAG: hypothetical protein HY365_00640 [Candidatus Aenigmarchaeota archaeon]|nr:hypothetical protein [Candidatus Aenigmarchaeota archaeon]